MARTSIGEGSGTLLQHSCLENPMDGGAWWAAVYGVAQSRTRLKRPSSSSSTSMGFPGGAAVKSLPASTGDVGSIPELGRALEKEMVAHSSLLAWEIPWTEEPGRLQPMESQRVRHDCARTHARTHTRTHAHTHRTSTVRVTWRVRGSDASCSLDIYSLGSY